MLHCAGIKHQIHYLDDFLFMGAPDTEEGAPALSIAQTVLQHLGIPIATHKREGPAILVAFLDILIDMGKFELRLPSDKVERLQSLLGEWLSQRACTR